MKPVTIKDKIASGLGCILEWYDFALYGFFAPIIAQIYFPNSKPGIGLLKALTVYAIGFIARPIGALLFGQLSDLYGRTKSLKLTPLLITFPTFILAILPTYQQIGVLAPIILIILRIWQGICIGGEFTNNLIYLCESSQPKRLYFSGSIGSCTGSLGIFLASSVTCIWYKLFTLSTLLVWGWRLAFAISFIIGITAYFLRKNMAETFIFQELYISKKIIHNPIINSFKSQYSKYFIASGLIFLPATAFYYVFMFLPNYLSESLNINSRDILGENSSSLFLRLLIIPIIGLIADKMGGLKIARLSCILFLLLSYPLFYGIIFIPEYRSIFIFSFALLSTLNAATTPGILVELLPPQTRCTILSLSFNVSFGVFGGMVPVVCFSLVDIFKNKFAPIYYLVIAAMITLITTFFFRRSTYEFK